MHTERRAPAIETGEFHLPARFWLPRSPRGVVIVLQPRELQRCLRGSGAVLEQLCLSGFGVLAVGLLRAEEESPLELAVARRFDIEELASRTVRVLDWVSAQYSGEPIALLAKGTAVAAGLHAAARRKVAAIVSIAGRPDLAAAALPRCSAPTLFVVGEDDMPGQHFSQLGADRMYCEREVQIIPGGGALERGGEVETSTQLALNWLERHFGPAPSPREKAPSLPAGFAQPILVGRRFEAVSAAGERSGERQDA